MSKNTKKCAVKEYFTKIDSISSRCKICCNIIKQHGNTTNLSNYMKRKHAQFLKTDEPPAKMPNILFSSENSSTKDSLFDDECFIDDGQLPSISMSKSACGSPIKLPSIKPIKSPTDSTPRQPPIDSAFKKINAYAGNPSNILLDKCF